MIEYCCFEISSQLILQIKTICCIANFKEISGIVFIETDTTIRIKEVEFEMDKTWRHKTTSVLVPCYV